MTPIKPMTVTPQAAAATLQRRSAQAQARESERATSIRDGLVQLVRSSLPEGGRAWLIGSLAWGGFGERSDADLVFEGVRDARITEIEVLATKTYAIEVDTLILSELPLSFRERIERDGLALHAC